MQVSSTDAAGVRWQASAVYRADAAGDIDLNSAAVLSGSYSGVSGMGLIWSMQPTRTPPLGAYSWGSAPRTFAVSVNAGGTRVASGEFRRTMSQAHLTQQDESVSADGFMGRYLARRDNHDRRPAVLVLDGLPGGMPTVLPAMLAASGYPALGVAYFKEPGLPQTLFLEVVIHLRPAHPAGRPDVLRAWSRATPFVEHQLCRCRDDPPPGLTPAPGQRPLRWRSGRRLAHDPKPTSKLDWTTQFCRRQSADRSNPD